MQFSKSIVFAAVALFAPLVMNADSISGPSSLSLGGLTFGNFQCSVSSSDGVTATPNACTQINVAPILVPGNGIQFSSGFLATQGAFEDATLSYSVSSPSAITSVGLYFNGYFEGLGITSVTETVFDGSNLIGSLKVTCSNGLCGVADENQTIDLSGYHTNLNIQKDIQVNSASLDVANYAGLSFVDQTFTTADVATPEPAALGLIGAGLLAAGAIRRRAVKA